MIFLVQFLFHLHAISRRGALFVKGSSVAKILEQYESTRCQIKDMDIVFPQVPLNPVLAKWFGYCDSMKYGSF